MRRADRNVATLIDADQFMRDLDAIVEGAAGRAYTTILQFRASGARRHHHVLSQRIFSTVPDAYPVDQQKALEKTPWLDHVHLRHEPFLASGAEALAKAFPDYKTVLRLDAVRLANFPIVMHGRCIGLINVAQSGEHDVERLMSIGPKAATLFGPVAAALLNDGDGDGVAD